MKDELLKRIETATANLSVHTNGLIWSEPKVHAALQKLHRTVMDRMETPPQLAMDTKLVMKIAHEFPVSDGIFEWADAFRGRPDFELSHGRAGVVAFLLIQLWEAKRRLGEAHVPQVGPT